MCIFLITLLGHQLLKALSETDLVILSTHEDAFYGR